MVKNNKKLYKKLSIACVTLGLITSSIIGGKLFNLVNDKREAYKKIEDFRLEISSSDDFQKHKEDVKNNLNKIRDSGLLSQKEYEEKLSKIDTIDYFYNNREKYLNKREKESLEGLYTQYKESSNYSNLFGCLFPSTLITTSLGCMYIRYKEDMPLRDMFSKNDDDLTM
jgi:hypothetical protein